MVYHLKNKAEYRYKVDDKYIYYVKEDLEKHKPFIRDGVGKESFGKYKEVSGEAPVGTVAGVRSEQDKNEKQCRKNGMRHLEQSNHIIYTKIVPLKL